MGFLTVEIHRIRKAVPVFDCHPIRLFLSQALRRFLEDRPEQANSSPDREGAQVWPYHAAGIRSRPLQAVPPVCPPDLRTIGTGQFQSAKTWKPESGHDKIDGDQFPCSSSQ